jgi:iron complex outermembrane receptor protein
MRATRTGRLLISSAVIALMAQAWIPAARGEPAAATDAPASDPTLVTTSEQIPAPPAESEQILVTARKRSETLIEVPQSVTAVSGAALETQEAESFEDYAKLIPGLQLNQDAPGETRLTIRGLNTGGVASTVGVYVDETPFGSSSGLANGAILAGDFDTFDLARIEVLRGPEGTLYGANALGGVLKFVTNPPDPDDFSARFRSGVESVDGGGLSYVENAMVNIPVGSTLAFRASASYHNNSGFIDSLGTDGSQLRNDINDSNEYSERAALLYVPTSYLNFRLGVVSQNIDTNAPSVVESDPITLDTLNGGRLGQSIFVSPYTDIKYRIYNGTGNLDLGFATLTSATSYETQNQSIREDATFELSGTIDAIFGIPNDLYLQQETNLSKFTQELRLASSPGKYLDWVVGGYYTNEDGLIGQQFVPVVPGTLTDVTALPSLAKASVASSYEEAAGFANTTVHVTDEFDIDLGGRESYNWQHENEAISGVLEGPASDLVQSSSESVFTYSVGPQYKFDDLASIYARVAKGFRPGGPNVPGPGAPPGSQTYRSDSDISYEAGVKAETEDRRYSVDFDVYHIDWSNIQLLTSVTTAGGQFSFNANGGGATSNGVEFTVTARPITGLRLSVDGAYDDAYLTKATPAVVGGSAGDALPFTPKYSFAVDPDYSWNVSDAMQAFVGGTVRYLSTQSGDFDAAYRAANGHQPELPAYAVLDVHSGLNFSRYSVELYAKNLNNADGKTSTILPGLYPNGAFATGVIQPRTIGMSVGVAF